MTNQSYTDFASHKLIFDFILNSKTGTLVFQPEGRKLFFQDGHLVFANSENTHEHFSHILIEMGVVDHNALLQVKNSLQKGQSLGKMLKESGLATSQQLVQSLKQQITTIVDSVFARESGECTVQEEPLPARVPTLKIQALALIIRTINNLKSRLFLKSLPFENDIEVVPDYSEKQALFDFPASYADFFSHIGTKGTFHANQVSDDFGWNESLTQGLFYVLYHLNLIDFKDSEPVADLMPFPENLEDGLPSSHPEELEAEAASESLFHLDPDKAETKPMPIQPGLFDKQPEPVNSFDDETMVANELEEDEEDILMADEGGEEDESPGFIGDGPESGLGFVLTEPEGMYDEEVALSDDFDDESVDEDALPFEGDDEEELSFGEGPEEELSDEEELSFGASEEDELSENLSFDGHKEEDLPLVEDDEGAFSFGEEQEPGFGEATDLDLESQNEAEPTALGYDGGLGFDESPAEEIGEPEGDDFYLDENGESDDFSLSSDENPFEDDGGERPQTDLSYFDDEPEPVSTPKIKERPAAEHTGPGGLGQVVLPDVNDNGNGKQVTQGVILPEGNQEESLPGIPTSRPRKSPVIFIGLPLVLLAVVAYIGYNMYFGTPGTPLIPSSKPKPLSTIADQAEGQPEADPATTDPAASVDQNDPLPTTEVDTGDEPVVTEPVVDNSTKGADALPPEPKTDPAPRPRPATTAGVVDVAQLSTDSVARFRQQQKPYSIALMLACESETVTDFLAKYPNENLYIFPRNYEGRKCHTIAWGSFSSYKAAAGQVKAIPAGLAQEGKPWVKKF